MIYCKLKSKTLLPCGEQVRRSCVNGVGRGEEKENKNKGALMTKETVGMTFLLFSAIILFIAVTDGVVFGEIGHYITAFFVGLTGYYVYPLLLLAMYGSAVMVFGKKFVPARWIARVYLLLAAVFFIVHTATSEAFFGNGYGSYLAGCWSAATESLANGTGGGVLFGLIAYPVRAALSPVGAYIFYSLLILLALWFILIATPLRSLLLPSARARKMPEQPKAVTFSDLPEPEPGVTLPEQPAVAAPRPAPAPVSAPSPAPAPAAAAPVTREEAYRRSRDLLYRGDPARRYTDNLIFDRDSAFNTRPRSSSVAPVEPSAPVQPARPAQPARTQDMRYSERYAEETSREGYSVPRRVSQVQPEAPAVREDDFSYPTPPSYRAPEQSAPPAAEERDYYEHDVPYGQELSSQPSVYDLPDPEPVRSEPVQPARYEAEPVRSEPVQPARPTYEAEPVRSEPVQPVRPTYEAEPVRSEPVQPARPTYEAEPARSEPVQPARPTYEAEPVRSEPAQPARPTYEAEPFADGRTSQEKERGFRGLFSQPVPERTRITPSEPARPSYEESAPAEGASGRFDDEPDENSRVYGSTIRGSAADLLDDDGDTDDGEAMEDMPAPLLVRGERGERGERGSFSRGESRFAEQSTPVPEEEAPAPQRHIYKPYVHPDLSDLKDYPNTSGVTQEEIEQNSAVIVDTLAGFRVDAEVIKVRVGATVTRYDIDIPKNIAVAQVIRRDAEIALRLHASDGVNIYSNSEAGAISIEVPNSVTSTVGLKSVMQSEKYLNGKPGSLMFAIGQDVEGRNVVGDIVKMTHLLVAGSTNSGKSICLDSMIVSLIYKYSPEDLRLILIDPKKSEFIVFDGLPHLMINEIISDAQKAVAAFNWAIKEMERRFTLFEKKTRSGTNVRDIDGYNNALTEDEEKLPKIVIVVDELADLMSVAKKDIEERIQRISQKARAAGIHLVLATQRPSVDVITGVIKSNLPTRMALRVISDVDSRTILDESGAQKLLGKGDMLFREAGMRNTMRVQGAFVHAQEMQAVVQDIKAHNEAYFDSSVADYINKTEGEADSSGGGGDADDAVDPQYIKALGIVVKLGQASISLIQRKCSVGYNHAGKIIEWMELMGYITPFDGKAKARNVLLSPEDFQAKYGDID